MLRDLILSVTAFITRIVLLHVHDNDKFVELHVILHCEKVQMFLNPWTYNVTKERKYAITILRVTHNFEMSSLS